MSNCEVFKLPALEAEHGQIREVLRCLLHTIIFNRALGLLSPKEITSSLFDITYAHCGETSVDQQVEDKISAYLSWLERNPTKQGQLLLSFYETRRKQAWFAAQEERLYWEQWCIPLSLLSGSCPPSPRLASSPSSAASEATRVQRQAKLQSGLQESLITIVRLVNEKRDHIPPVVTTGPLTFPFDITTAGDAASGFGLDSFRRMLTQMQTTPPPMLS